MNLSGELRQEIKCSFRFSKENLIEQAKKQLAQIYGEAALDNLVFKCIGNNNGIIIDVSTRVEEDPNASIKRRGRKPKNAYSKEISFEPEDVAEEDENIVEDTEEEESTKEEVLDISKNEDVKNPSIKKLALLSDSDKDLIPKELTPAQYKILREKSTHSKLELISLMEYESNPKKVYEALYKDNEPQGVINENAATVNDIVSPEEEAYVRCFATKKRMEGYQVKIPKFSTCMYDGNKVAFCRQVECIDPSTKKTTIYIKKPNEKEMISL